MYVCMYVNSFLYLLYMYVCMQTMSLAAYASETNDIAEQETLNFDCC